MTKTICVFGSASDVGKSVTAAAIGRILHREGLKVCPFKAQNMSNNAGVVRRSVESGVGEIGRAQVVQAEACSVEPETDMNPVLLKPSSDRSSQVVVHGKVLGDVEAKLLWQKGGSTQSPLREAARQSLKRLEARFEVIVAEGAGSCGEVNLRDRDYVNFDVAHTAETAAVLLVCDIEKGGVFAQVVGTLAVLPPKDRQLIKGIIINKFRGDASLFDDGRVWLETETGLPVLAVVPYFDPLDVKGDGTRCIIDAEDGLHATARVDPTQVTAGNVMRIAVILLPRIANHTDFAPLHSHPGIELDWLRLPRDLGRYHMVIVPGSKSVISDLTWLREVGWAEQIKNYHQTPNTVLVGVCGGYQMLGARLKDASGIDGCAAEAEGLGYLPVVTEMSPDKTLLQAEGTWACDSVMPMGTKVKGYEIHCGQTKVLESGGHVVDSDTGSPGYVKLNENKSIVLGTYLHGVFDSTCTDAMLAHMVPDVPRTVRPSTTDSYDALADHYDKALGEGGRKVLLSLVS